MGCRTLQIPHTSSCVTSTSLRWTAGFQRRFYLAMVLQTAAVGVIGFPLNFGPSGGNSTVRFELISGIGDGDSDRFSMDIQTAIFDAASCGWRVDNVKSVADFAERTVAPQPCGSGLRLGGSQPTQTHRVTHAFASTPKPYGLGHFTGMADTLPTEAQRKRLCELMHNAFVELRHLTGEQAHDLAYAFHNLPMEIYGWGTWTVAGTRARLQYYQKKHSRNLGVDYVALFDKIYGP